MPIPFDLVQWDVKRADELCIPAYLEASDVGYGLYAKAGIQESRRSEDCD